MSRTLTIDDLLGHMSKQIDLIDRVTSNMTEDEFVADEIAQMAVVKCIENMGEAAKLLRDNHPSFIAQETGVNWRGLTAMRNVLAHRYFSIDYELVWHTVQTDIPSIARALQDIADDDLVRQQAYRGGSHTR